MELVDTYYVFGIVFSIIALIISIIALYLKWKDSKLFQRLIENYGKEIDDLKKDFEKFKKKKDQRKSNTKFVKTKEQRDRELQIEEDKIQLRKQQTFLKGIDTFNRMVKKK